MHAPLCGKPSIRRGLSESGHELYTSCLNSLSFWVWKFFCFSNNVSSVGCRRSYIFFAEENPKFISRQSVVFVALRMGSQNSSVSICAFMSVEDDVGNSSYNLATCG